MCPAKVFRLLPCIATLLSLLGSSLSHAGADQASVLILDASGSMWGQLQDGRSKIEVAREVMSGYLQSRDADQPLGIIAYGHNRRGDCQDIEVLSSVGPQPPAPLIQLLQQINPRGKTPLGQSLKLASAQIPTTAEEADIILITDGLETCDVDPCTVAAELAASGIRIRAHVVGFGLSENEAQGLACIAEQTGGLLLRPQTGAELADALARTSTPVPTNLQGVRLIFSYPGSMPDSYEWRVVRQGSGEEILRQRLTNEARYQPFPLELTAGDYTAYLQAQAGKGQQHFSLQAKAQDVVVTLVPDLPVAKLSNQGPYAAHDETLAIPLNVLAEGQETHASALSLLLFPADGGEQITYFTVEGKKGQVMESINLPGPGRYLLRLASANGDVLDEMLLDAQLNPAVSLQAPALVAPGQAIPVSSRGSQLWYDQIGVWQGEQEIQSSIYLGEISAANPLLAPSQPGQYELVYRGYNANGEIVEKARLPIQVGASDDETKGNRPTQSGLAPQTQTQTQTSIQTESPLKPTWPTDAAYQCEGPAPCLINDPTTGLAFALPVGWWAEQPTMTPYTSGAQAAGQSLPPHLNIYHASQPDYLIALGPHQWLESDGPCREAGSLGQICMRHSNELEALAAYEMVRTTLKWRRQIHTSANGPDIVNQVRRNISDQPAEVQNAINALLGAAQNNLHNPQALADTLMSMANGKSPLAGEDPGQESSQLTPAGPLQANWRIALHNVDNTPVLKVALLQDQQASEAHGDYTLFSGFDQLLNSLNNLHATENPNFWHGQSGTDIRANLTPRGPVFHFNPTEDAQQRFSIHSLQALGQDSYLGVLSSADNTIKAEVVIQRQPDQ
ncbi:VWA domain-containing protein [Balneatrix alpica]|uniref:VWA domain-containing protein n=1 Tax=Balneatrix alpica TaxID=75684 RepID=A0ABV5ZDV4_9GAMM